MKTRKAAEWNRACAKFIIGFNEAASMKTRKAQDEVEVVLDASTLQ